MKITLIALGMLLSCLCLQAQSPSVERFFEKYSDYENTLDITLKGWMLKGASLFTDDENSKQMMRKISKLRILIMDDGKTVSKQEIGRLLNNVRHQQFEDLMEIRDDGNKINFLIREDNNRITDVIMSLRGDDEFLLLSLEGLFKFEDLNKLELDMQGGEHFKKVPNKRSEIPQA